MNINRRVISALLAVSMCSTFRLQAIEKKTKIDFEVQEVLDALDIFDVEDYRVIDDILDDRCEVERNAKLKNPEFQGLVDAFEEVKHATRLNIPDTLVKRSSKGGFAAEHVKLNNLKVLDIYGDTGSKNSRTVVVEPNGKFSSFTTLRNVIDNGPGALCIGDFTITGSAVVGTDLIVTNTLYLDANTHIVDNMGQTFMYNGGFLHDSTYVGLSAGNFGDQSGDQANTGVGYHALYDNTGTQNVAVGYEALQNNDKGNANIALGFQSLSGNNNGNTNIALGLQSLQGNIRGSDNIALGTLALKDNNLGNSNIAIGRSSLQKNSGSSNIALGNQAGLNALGSNNILIGSQGEIADFGTIRLGTTSTHTSCYIAGIRDVTTGVNDAALVVIDSNGQLGTAYSNIVNTATGGLCTGDFVVTNTLYLDSDTHITDSSGNNFIYSTGIVNGSTYVGLLAGNIGSPTDGGNNTALGYQSLQGNIDGHNNTAVGVGALISNHSNSHGNIALGLQALDGNRSNASFNIALGNFALRNNLGSYNIALGNNIGVGASGSNNIWIGNLGSGGDSGVIRIGDSVNQKACYVAGIRGVTTGTADAMPVLVDSKGQLGTMSSSKKYKDDIQDMAEKSARLMQLRPVTFTYKGQTRQPNSLEYGLIAEEVAEVCPELVIYKDGAPETVRYHLLAPMLLNEYQQQNKKLDGYGKELDGCKTDINDLNNVVQDLLKRLDHLEK